MSRPVNATGNSSSKDSRAHIQTLAAAGSTILCVLLPISQYAPNVLLQGPLGPRELATSLHAVATLGHVPQLSWLLAVGNLQHTLLPWCSVRDLASVVWALSAILQAAQAASAVQQPGRMDSSSVGSTKGGSASAVAGHALMDGPASHVRPAAGHAPTPPSTPSVAQLLPAVLRVLPALIAHTQQLLEQANDQDLSNLTLGTSRVFTLAHNNILDTAPPQPDWLGWRAALLDASLTQMPRCGPQALSNLAHALGHLPGPHPTHQWRTAFAESAARQLPSFSSHAVAQMLGSCSRLGWAPGSAWPQQLLHQIQVGCDLQGSKGLQGSSGGL